MSDANVGRGKSFFGDESASGGDEATYRAISPGAFVAVAFGLASAAAFLAPVLWTIPAIGSVFSLLMLRRLRLNADRYAGERLVWVGLLLCLLFLGWAPARYVQRISILEDRARRIAIEWTDLICEGKLDEAHQWHLAASERAPPGQAAAFYAERPEMAGIQQQFFSGSTLTNWLRLGVGSKPHFVRFVGREPNSGGTENYVYEFRIDGAAVKQSLPVFVVIARRTASDNPAEMFVLSVVGLDPFVKEYSG